MHTINYETSSFFYSRKNSRKKQFILEDIFSIHQIKNVLRLKKGNQIILADDSGMEYTCSFVPHGKNKILFNVLEFHIVNNISKINLHLF